MGYTHYWQVKLKTKTDIKNYKTALSKIAKLVYAYNQSQPKGSVQRLSGYSGHAKPKAYDGIFFNGSGEHAHEDFSLPADKTEFSDFCKTNQKPYDIVVVASLCILNHYVKDSVASDGDSSDWIAGLALAKSIVPNATMPKSIRTRLRIAN